jgi:hypothetical protein
MSKVSAADRDVMHFMCPHLIMDNGHPVCLCDWHIHQEALDVLARDIHPRRFMWGWTDTLMAAIAALLLIVGLVVLPSPWGQLPACASGSLVGAYFGSRIAFWMGWI